MTTFTKEQMLSHLESHYQKLSQGFYSVVFQIDDKTVIKINSGDYDYGFKRFAEYAIKKKTEHLPEIYEFHEQDGWYYCVMEMLSKYPDDIPDPEIMIELRTALRNQANNVIKNYEGVVKEITDEMKDFDYTGCSIDVNILNVMLRNQTLVLIDPITILK